jgi:hypothetical protein
MARPIEDIDRGDPGGGGGFDGGSGSTPLPVLVDSRDVSGGGTSPPVAQAAQEIEEFQAEGGGVLPIVYGEHFIAGILIVHKFTLGTPNSSIVYVALGDAQGDGGGHGEWDSAVAVYYAGEPYGVSPNSVTPGYRFYPGFISTAVASGPQQVDAFLSNLAYSGTAYIAVKVTDADANAEDRPDKLRGRYKGRKTKDFDVVGRETAYNYSVNPARIATDRILAFYEHRFPNDAALALRKLQEKVDWESWFDWKAYNAASTSWFNGTTTVSIPRFEGHVVFTQDLILADALDQICATAGAFWQDDGEQIIFQSPAERDSVHHFDESNIAVGSLRIEPRDLRERPNYFITEFRDYDDVFLGLSSVEVRRDALIKRVGEIKSTRAMPPMRQSQAQRLTERMARLEADNPNICSLIGDETSIHVSPGDFVTVSHPIPNWTYQRCLVLSATLSSAENSPDTCEFTVQQIDDLLYSDTAHGPRQEALTP